MSLFICIYIYTQFHGILFTHFQVSYRTTIGMYIYRKTMSEFSYVFVNAKYLFQGQIKTFAQRKHCQEIFGIIMFFRVKCDHIIKNLVWNLHNFHLPCITIDVIIRCYYRCYYSYLNLNFNALLLN